MMLNRRSWLLVAISLFAAGIGLIFGGLALARLHDQAKERDSLVKALGARQDALDGANVQAKVREDALRSIITALQTEVAAQGGEPPSIPVSLRTTPEITIYNQQPQAVSSPTPKPSPTPTPSPTRNPNGLPCVVPAAQPNCRKLNLR